MSDYTNIIQEINTNLPDNNQQSITAQKVRTTLVDMLGAVDDNMTQAISGISVPTKTSDLTNDNGFITASALNGYATETYVADYVASHSGQIDLSTYVTKDELSNAGYVTQSELNSASYATQAFVDDAIADAVIELNVPTKTSDLTNDSGFITASALNGLATETYVNSQISSAISEIDIPTKTSDLTNDSGFITVSDLTPYVTETELSAMSYVTQSALNSASYATTNDLNTAISGINVPTKTSDLTNDSGFITNSALNGLATEQYVQTAVSGLATEQYVDNAVGAITIPTKTSDLTNDSGFITSSALSGLATETYVTNAINGINVPTKTSDLTNDSGFITSIPAEFVTQSELSSMSYVTQSALNNASYATTSQLATKQDTLVSGTNIKTINGESILGSGNITIQGGGDTNVIESVSVNGTALTPDANKNVDITVPTNTNQLTNGAGFITSSALSGLATETYVTNAIADIDMPVIDESIIPNTTLTYTLGDSSHLYGEIYTNKLTGLSTGMWINNNFFFGPSVFRPFSNNTHSLGTSINKWKDIYTYSIYTYSTGHVELPYDTYLGGLPDVTACIITQSDYDNLSTEDKNKELLYIISDQQPYFDNDLVTEQTLATKGFLTADNFIYDPVTGTLTLNL